MLEVLVESLIQLHALCLLAILAMHHIDIKKEVEE